MSETNEKVFRERLARWLYQDRDPEMAHTWDDGSMDGLSTGVRKEWIAHAARALEGSGILAVIRAVGPVRAALAGPLPHDTPPSVRARIEAALALLNGAGGEVSGE